ncbi:glycosyl hydrolase family 65 protein [Lachnospiraceae bacterium 50-23]|jgi:alpha,alpha-trehalose phosphorylase|nr:glycoside hydrolase family 65 protein [Dorea sp.]
MGIRKEAIYPVQEWEITEKSFDKETNYRNETTFSLSNGYIGTRGTYEEAYPFDVDTGLEGNFVNGFYESEKIRYGEANFGSPLLSQSLLNLPNLKETRVYLDDEEFSMDTGKTEEYDRTLYMKDGVLVRRLLWTSPGGKKVRIQIRRLVSFHIKNIIAMEYQILPLNFSGTIQIVSVLQADVENHTRKTNPIVDYGPFGRKLEPLELTADNTELFYKGITQTSRLTVACGSSHTIIPSAGVTAVSGEEHTFDGAVHFKIQGREGQKITLEKFICYTSDLDVKKDHLNEFVKSMLKKATDMGYAYFEEKQKEYMHRFWTVADIEIEGDNSRALQQGIRFNLFHILQSAGRDGRTGMGAKGLSGEGYEGHYFWDTEMYILPVFIYTEPDLARRLLDYRYETLDQARARARVLGHERGALYPWRTINGEEASTYYPLGTAQYHINADIAYALSLYLQVTGDLEYFKSRGAEILIETARVWADAGSFAECRGGKYCICSVTGPDEYNVLVDNNFYTNLMARENLRDALYAVRYLRDHDPACLKGLEHKLHFSEAETGLWSEIIENMYFPYDETRQVYPLDDGFMMRRPWDESRIPPEKRAWLYENYHPLFIMRHRMSKQADAILGMYLHSHLFTEEEIRRNYDFYQEVTLHHSSLSTCIFGIVACEVGYYEEAYRYFSDSARMDLDDYHNNFYAGIHAANMAGTWQAIVNGFAGLRCHGSELYFKPALPSKWEKYTFKINYRNSLLKVCVERNRSQFTLEKGEGIQFYVNAKKVRIPQEGGTYIEEI